MRDFIEFFTEYLIVGCFCVLVVIVISAFFRAQEDMKYFPCSSFANTPLKDVPARCFYASTHTTN